MINVAAAMGLGNSSAFRSLENIQQLLGNLFQMKQKDYQQEERDRNEEIQLQQREKKDYDTLRKEESDAVEKIGGAFESPDGSFLATILGAGALIGGMTMLGGVGSQLGQFFNNVEEQVDEKLEAETSEKKDDKSTSTSTTSPSTEDKKVASGNSNIAKSGSGKAFEHYKYLTSSLGLSDFHARGLVANAMRESSLNPGAVGDGGNSYGLLQWNVAGDRRNKMVRAIPDWKTNWKAQYKYALTEDVGPKYKPKQFRSSQQAADWWMKYWERPASPSASSRKHSKILKQFKFQQGGMVDMNPSFSPVLKRSPLVTIPAYQMGGMTYDVVGLPDNKTDMKTGGSETEMITKPSESDYRYRESQIETSSGFNDTMSSLMGQPNIVPTMAPTESIYQPQTYSPSTQTRSYKQKGGTILKPYSSHKPFMGGGSISSVGGYQPKASGGYTTPTPGVSHTAQTNSQQTTSVSSQPKKPFTLNIIKRASETSSPKNVIKGELSRTKTTETYINQPPAMGLQVGMFVMPNTRTPQKKRTGGSISATSNDSMSKLTTNYDKQFFTRQAKSVQAPTVIVLNNSTKKSSPQVDKSQKAPQSGGGALPNYYSYSKMYSNYCRGIKV